MRQVRMRAGAAVVLRTLLATLLVASLLDKKNAILVRFVLLLLLEHDALAAHAVRIVGKAAPGTVDFGLESTQTCVEQRKGRDTIERKAEHAGHDESCQAGPISAGRSRKNHSRSLKENGAAVTIIGVTPAVKRKLSGPFIAGVQQNR